MRSLARAEVPRPGRFNEAAGADPADAAEQGLDLWPKQLASMRPRGQTPRMPCPLVERDRPAADGFNEAAGADPADARYSA